MSCIFADRSGFACGLLIGCLAGCFVALLIGPQPYQLFGVAPPDDPVSMVKRDVTPKLGAFYPYELPKEGLLTVIVLDVHDGDTCKVAYLMPASFRIDGINAPELKDPGGPEARQALTALIKGKTLPASIHGFEKFGRTLADIWLGDPDPKDLKKPAGWVSAWMVNNKFAAPWTGKGPRPVP